MTRSGHNLLNKASIYSTARIAIMLAALIAGASDTIATTGLLPTAIG
jgi:hypothetical protein